MRLTQFTCNVILMNMYTVHPLFSESIHVERHGTHMNVQLLEMRIYIFLSEKPTFEV